MQSTALTLSPLPPLLRRLNKNSNRRCTLVPTTSLKPSHLHTSINGLSIQKASLLSSSSSFNASRISESLLISEGRYDSFRVRAQQVPENMGETKSSTGLGTSLKLGAMFAIWVWNSDDPYNVGFKYLPSTKAYSFSVIIPLAVVHTLGNLLTNVSVGKVNVSFTHTIKAMEPFFTVLFFVLVLGEWPSFWMVSSLVPVVGGVALASFTEASFNWIGFCTAIASNVTNQSRNVLSKKFMVSYMILQMVSPVTHSVGNCVKRVVVISYLLPNTVSPINSLGTTLAFTGVFLYSNAKQMKPKPKAA
ncbi:hypothetical protein F3Y22_tig00019709pilonHSYRG00002 [Hibiscus syriacus]|uniref:Sugar phosphate transporter domain-containing protein n=1 Tax=Hibiscus syriacus TaxID=106335 RepID=A0A6A3BV46_HIBSY|nr:hypothetical protein F3Y22_tig00019709pilonHSYRG00002 [Hibiscus syriacus]